MQHEPLDMSPADTRPQHGSWAPGSYICKCYSCGFYFTGDKRALSCAECAYNNGWRLMNSAPKDGTVILAYRPAEHQTQQYHAAHWRKDLGGTWEWGGHGWSYPHEAMPTHWKRLPDPPPA